MNLEKKKHVQYFKRNLAVLPQPFQDYDSSLTSLACFSMCGLQLLGAFEEIYSDKDKLEMVEWVYSHLVPSRQGFRGSMSHAIRIGADNAGYASRYDPPHLASTFFCLCMLAMLHDPLSQLGEQGKQNIFDYVMSCQLPSGIFTPYHGAQIHESDIRYIYMAIAILRMLGGDKSDSTNIKATIDKAIRYIQAAVGYDGGFSDSSNGESHAGLTFCAVGTALATQQISPLDAILPTPEHQRQLVQWLVSRQQPDGGFNGRVNKMSDTCYSFWVGASLAMISKHSVKAECLPLSLVDKQAAVDFLLKQQHPIVGGFVKTQGSMPDPLHSCLGLAALSLFGHTQLEPLDASFCLPVSAVEFIASW